LFYASPGFSFAGVLLSSWLVPLLITIPHLVEWIRER